MRPLKINPIGLDREMIEALAELEDPLGITLSEDRDSMLVVTTKSAEELKLVWKDGTAIICYRKKSEIFRALGHLKEYLSENRRQADFSGKKEFIITESAAFDTLCMMPDYSRNAVNNLPTVKKLIRILAVMGYTMLMTYTEDTYEVDGQPYFGYMRGRQRAGEIAEIDRYAALFGIEVVPCIQTLAHLGTLLKWPVYHEVRDINDILLVGESKTYELLDAMIGSVSTMYHSRKINIGMDEAFVLGRGRYLDRNGKTATSEIMIRHLAKVLEICKKYGMQPLMWSDMFFRNSDGKAKDIAGNLVKDVPLIHWDYVSDKAEYYEEAFARHKEFTDHVLFAGGAWKWEGFAPFNQYSLLVGRSALAACHHAKIEDVIVTAWGDNGGEASIFSVLPIYQLFAESCYADNTTDEHLRMRLKACANAEMSDFIDLDLPHIPLNGDPGGGYRTNPAKYMLYQDPLCGLYDRHVLEDQFAAHYKESIAVLQAGRARNPRWTYVFDLMIALCEVLELKCDIGIKLKKAYDCSDKDALQALVQRLYLLKAKTDQFRRIIRIQWLTENKPFGLDVQDLRIGGLIARIDTAIYRIEGFLSGEFDRLEELEQERLYADCRPENAGGSPHTHCWSWQEIVTAGIL